jgi:2-oxo-3-hexenedioate decarboxylase
VADAVAIAEEAQAALDAGRPIQRFTARDPSFDVEAARPVTAALRAIREARGERSVGRKIGFTNRGIWDEYRVYAPIWGYMYDTTVREVSPGEAVPVSHLPEPRIEPEIVLGLGRDLTPGMDLDAIAAAVDWVAHGFEIVQSIYPGWSFAAADCIADGGLHGRLFLGPRRHLSRSERASLAKDLSVLRVTLLRNGATVDGGSGANVLDGPVQALSHLVAVLADDPFNPPLAAGEMVTTGTMTRAFPVLPGERWSTTIADYPLPGISIAIG